MSEIIYPTVDLFLYDLKSSLGEQPEVIQKNRTWFEQKFPQEIKKELLPESDEGFEPEEFFLLEKRFKAYTTSQNGLEGYYYPVRLGDTYSLILECTFQDHNTPFAPQAFTQLKAEIEQRLKDKPATLGQTWVISGYLSKPLTQPEDIENLAKDCYQSLMPGLNWEQELDGKGLFLGANIFQLSRTKLVKTKIIETETVLQNHQIIIIIYPDKTSLELSAKFSLNWRKLLYYHHKTTWAYGQSLQITQSIKHDFSVIQYSSQLIDNKVNNKNKLKQLNLTLEKIRHHINNYTLKLNFLDFQSGTIEINLNNYQKRLKAIEEKAILKSQNKTDLGFLANWIQLVNEKYLLQVKKDRENLERGLKFIETNINAIRSQIEIEKAERDQKFQNLITVVGTSIAVAALIDSPKEDCNANYELIKNIIPINFQVICNHLPLLYSLTIAICVALIILLIKKFLSSVFKQ